VDAGATTGVPKDQDGEHPHQQTQHEQDAQHEIPPLARQYANPPASFSRMPDDNRFMIR
jgi:hypothetical protein